MMESHPVRTASCLSDVLDGIAVSAKTPASLRKACLSGQLSSPWGVRLGSAPGTNRGTGCCAAQGGNRGSFAVHTTGTRSRTNREADVGYTGAMGHGGNPGSRAGGGGVCPDWTSATADRRHATVPEFPEQTVEVVPAPTERVHQRTVEQVPVPQILAETVEVALVPRERVRHGIVDVPVPQVLEETVEVGRLDPHEQTVDRRANCGCTSFSGRDRSGGEVVLYKNKCSGSTPIPQFVVLLVHQERVQWCASKLWRCFRSAIENESQRRQ